MSMAARFLLLVMLLGSLATEAGASDGPPPAAGIHPHERLLVKVLEWQPGKGEYRDWTAVGGEYEVSAAGTVSIPFAGEVPVGGRSTTELATEIAASLQRNLALTSRPAVSVEFALRSPVYVIGGVDAPGSVEFRPSLTVTEAVALAGGFYRGGGGTLRLERDAINAQADLATAEDAVARLEARLLRLEAELAGREELEVDTGRGSAVRPDLVEEERRIFEARRQARESQLESLHDREELASDQLEALREKAVNLDRQIQLTKKQLEGVDNLVGKGLAVASRSLTLERTLSEQEGKRLDLEVATLEANLAINEAQRDRVDLLTAFRTEVAKEIQTTHASLAQAKLKVDRGESLLREATIIMPEKVMDRAGNMMVGIQFFVTRKNGDSVSTFEVGKDAPLQAGDTLQVQLNLDRARPGKSTASVSPEQSWAPIALQELK